MAMLWLDDDDDMNLLVCVCLPPAPLSSVHSPCLCSPLSFCCLCPPSFLSLLLALRARRAATAGARARLCTAATTQLRKQLGRPKRTAGCASNPFSQLLFGAQLVFFEANAPGYGGGASSCMGALGTKAVLGSCSLMYAEAPSGGGA
eukprot:m.125153 g.125153  ORF g.125153 m.125153 type:complete len:147 (+) comp9685_c0_seq12:771-1211(+)